MRGPGSPLKGRDPQPIDIARLSHILANWLRRQKEADMKPLTIGALLAAMTPALVNAATLVPVVEVPSDRA